MFKAKRFGNRIISDEGFEVEIASRGRDSLTYLEGNKEIFINSETFSDDKGIGIAFWKDSIKKWRPPHDSEIIDEEKRDEIIRNLVRALEFAKFAEIQVI